MTQKKKKGRTFTAEQEAIFKKAAAEDDAEIEDLRKQAEDAFALHDAVSTLRQERQAQGLSLADMEVRCGITRATLSRLENALQPNPTIHTLQRIAAALGVELTIGVRRPRPRRKAARR